MGLRLPVEPNRLFGVHSGLLRLKSGLGLCLGLCLGPLTLLGFLSSRDDCGALRPGLLDADPAAVFRGEESTAAQGLFADDRARRLFGGRLGRIDHFGHTVTDADAGLVAALICRDSREHSVAAGEVEGAWTRA